METTVKIETTCYHCGADSGDAPVIYDGKTFCCNGCVSVYKLLNETGLDSFYNMEERPGARTYRNDPDRFVWLDEPEAQKALIKYSDEKQVLVSFYIPDIHCASCVWLLEKLPILQTGVLQSEVDFLRKEVRVWFDPKTISLRAIVELLAWIGYEPMIQLSDLDKKEQTFNPLRRTYLKLGLAGFAFGNVMIYSLPEYFGLDVYSPGLRFLFVWINALLSIPVLVFSAEDYWKSAWMSIKGKRITMDVPITLGIIAMFVQSAYELFTKTGSGYFDSFTGLIFFLLIGKLFQQKTYHAISFFRDYRSYFPMSVNVQTESGFQSIPLSRLKKSDVIRVRNEELIPADAQLISDSASIDYHFVTGESAPVSIQKGDEVFAGGRLKGCEALFMILKSVDQSYLTQLWNHDIFKKDKLTNHVTLADRVSPYFTWVVVSVALIALFIWGQTDWHKAAQVFTSVLIIACPCALALSMPFTLGNVLNVFSKNDFYVRSERIVERLAKASILVFDKTGTLTESGDLPVEYRGRELTDEYKQWIYAAVTASIHPLSQAIAHHLKKFKGLQADTFNEIKGLGLVAEVSGHKVVIGSEKWLNQNHIETQDYMGGYASKTYVGIDTYLFGSFIFEQKVRSGVQDMIQRLKKLGYTLIGLSGDVQPKTGAIKQVFDGMSGAQFECKPDDKLQFITDLKFRNQDKTIVMIGDGLNDAGALRAADVGLAVSDDVHSFSPGCDGILQARKIHKLDAFLHLSKDAQKVIYTSYTLSFLYNVIGLSFAVSGMLSPLVSAVLMPISSISVLIFTTSAVFVNSKRRGL